MVVDPQHQRGDFELEAPEAIVFVIVVFKVLCVWATKATSKIEKQSYVCVTQHAHFCTYSLFGPAVNLNQNLSLGTRNDSNRPINKSRKHATRANAKSRYIGRTCDLKNHILVFSIAIKCHLGEHVISDLTLRIKRHHQLTSTCGNTLKKTWFQRKHRKEETLVRWYEQGRFTWYMNFLFAGRPIRFIWMLRFDNEHWWRVPHSLHNQANVWKMKHCHTLQLLTLEV